MSEGKLVIVSGPSGAGKGTVLRKVFEQCPVPLAPSVSATTRRPRAGEANGVDYHFLSFDKFEAVRREGGFLECVQVFGNGDWYGTLRGEVEAGLAAGKWVVLEIDVQGALDVMAQYSDAISIFVQPGSRAELEQRLRGRGTEDEDTIQRRLKQADYELSLAEKYRYQVVNDTVDRAAMEICHILKQEAETSNDDRCTAG